MLLAAALALSVQPLPAQAPEGANLVLNPDFTQGLERWGITQDETCTPRAVEADLAGHAQALHLTLRPHEGADPWSIMLVQPVNAFLNQGDQLVLSFWARSPESLTVNAYLEIPRDPWTKSPGEMVTLTPEWREHTLRGAAG